MSEQHPIAEAIDRVISETQNTDHRNHIGPSVLADKCSRKIWYGFRWVTPVDWPPRILRLFARGKLEEARFVEWLQSIGVTVWQVDPATGEQYRFMGYKGHFCGEIDGVGSGVIPSPFLLEFKTHNAQSFKEVQSNGVEAGKWEHYVQVQLYMGMMGLSSALYGAINKNTDELYFETILFSQECFDIYVKRAQDLIDMAEPPPRISRDPTWWECKFCEHQAICHHGQLPLKNCRTCAHSTPIENAQWQCEQDRTQSFPIIPIEVIKTGCARYTRHPME